MKKIKSLDKLKIFPILLLIALLSAGFFWFWQKDKFSPKLNQNIQEKLKTQTTNQESLNTSGYVTLHPAYGRAEGADKYGNWAIGGANVEISGSWEKFRVFIPPGTQRYDLTLFSSGNISEYSAVMRFQQLPDNLPNSSTDFCSGSGCSLDEISGKDGFFRGNLDGWLPLSNDFFRNGLNLNEGGWLYVRLDRGQRQWFGYIQLLVKANSQDYNNWWDNYGSNSDGSINWEKDIESVTTYTAKKKLQGDIEPQSSPDGDVDIFDYNVFIQYWSQSPTNNPADIDQNGKVDIFDYNILVGNFGKTSGK